MNDKNDLLIKIARLYYLEEMNQKDIAKKLQMSLAGVSRSINKAKDLGIVTIQVKGTDDKLEQLEIQMEKDFGLRECLLVPSADTLDVMYKDMAQKVIPLLERILTSKSVLGVSWGRTLKIMGENLSPRDINCQGVIPIIGALGMIETGIYPNYISKRFADSLNTEAYLVNAPGVVDSRELRDFMMNDSNFKHVELLWNKVDTILFSVSTIGPGTSLYMNNIFPTEDLQRLNKAGAKAAFNFNFIDDTGKPVNNPIQDRIINLDAERMSRIKHRILAAAGPEKTDAIRIALEGNTCDILITDANTAAALLG